MLSVLLVLQIIVTVSMIVVILIQRSASDGMAGLAGGGNSLMSGRASANLLTKITSILGAVFIINSLAMATISARSASSKSIVDDIKIEQKAPAAPLADKPLNKDVSGDVKPKESPATSNKTDKKAKAPESTESEPSVPIAE